MTGGAPREKRRPVCHPSSLPPWRHQENSNSSSPQKHQLERKRGALHRAKLLCCYKEAPQALSLN